MKGVKETVEDQRLSTQYLAYVMFMCCFTIEI